MNNNIASQSFNVDDIRRIRVEDDLRYSKMSAEEISHDIHELAQEGYKIVERIRKEKSARQYDEVAK